MKRSYFAIATNIAIASQMDYSPESWTLNGYFRTRGEKVSMTISFCCLNLNSKLSNDCKVANLNLNGLHRVILSI